MIFLLNLNKTRLIESERLFDYNPNNFKKEIISKMDLDEMFGGFQDDGEN